MEPNPTSPPPKRLSYFVAAFVIFLVACISILLVEQFRLGKDNTTLNGMIAGFALTTCASVLALLKSQETHLSVNSRLDDFIKNAREAAHAEGVTEGQNKSIVETKKEPT